MHLGGGCELLGAAHGGLGSLVCLANRLLKLVCLVAERGSVHGDPRSVLVSGNEALSCLQTPPSSAKSVMA
jgi:hypothetical protein